MVLSSRDLYLIKVCAEFTKCYIMTSELLKVEIQVAEQDTPTILPNKLENLTYRIKKCQQELKEKYGS